MDLRGDSVLSGDTIYATLWWRLKGDRIGDEYATILSLHDAAGQPVAQVDSGYDIPFQTSSWVPGAVIEERLAIQVPPGTPPGEYSRTPPVAPRSSSVPQAVDAGGAVLGDDPQAAQVRIMRPARPADPASLGLERMLDQPLSPEIEVVGVTMQPTANDVGQPFYLMLGWRATGFPRAILVGNLSWVGESGQVNGSRSFELTPGYPTDQWRAGDVWRTSHVLFPAARAGTYTMRLELFGQVGQMDNLDANIGTMTISAPSRL
jgi:hypothetical protein